VRSRQRQLVFVIAQHHHDWDAHRHDPALVLDGLHRTLAHAEAAEPEKSRSTRRLRCARRRSAFLDLSINHLLEVSAVPKLKVSHYVSRGFRMSARACS